MVRAIIQYESEPDAERYAAHIDEFVTKVDCKAFRHGRVFGSPFGEPSARYYAEFRDANVRSGEVLWPAIKASGDAADGFPALRSSPPQLVIGGETIDGIDEFEEDLGMLAGKPRVWFVFSHVVRWAANGVFDDTPAHIALLDRAGERRDEFLRTGAAAYLMDMRDSAEG